MSTQSDLRLVGNIVLDEVCYVENWPSRGTSNTYRRNGLSVGGLGNILAALPESELEISLDANLSQENIFQVEKIMFGAPKVRFHLSQKPSSTALIFCDNDERTSFVEWGAGEDPVPIPEERSKWAHVSYLDVTPFTDIASLRSMSDIVSADLCLSRMAKDKLIQLESQLKYLDYLFMSSSELAIFSENGESAGQTLSRIKSNGPKTIIFHKRENTTIIDASGTIIIPAGVVLSEYANVLGAGDAYCANFVLARMKGLDIEGSVLKAHEKATEFVLNRNPRK